MKDETIMKMMVIIQEIKSGFNTDSYLYYDEQENDISIAIPDADLYWNDDFRNFLYKTHEAHKDEKIYIINLPEKIIKSSALFKDFVNLYELFNTITIKYSSNIEIKNGKMEIYYVQNPNQTKETPRLKTSLSVLKSTKPQSEFRFYRDQTNRLEALNNLDTNLVA